MNRDNVEASGRVVRADGLWGTHSRVLNTGARSWWWLRQAGAWPTLLKALSAIRIALRSAAEAEARQNTPDLSALGRCTWLNELPTVHKSSLEVSRRSLSLFMETVQYPKYYYSSERRVRYALWHMAGFLLAGISRSDVVLDVGAQAGIWGRIARRRHACRVIDLDLEYRSGVRHDRVGADAGDIPLADHSVSCIVSFCALNCFEGPADIRCFCEAERLLVEGGRLVVVPLCVGDRHVNLFDPKLHTGRRSFDQNAIAVAVPGWGNPFGRWYDERAFCARVLDNLRTLDATVVEIHHECPETRWLGPMYAGVFVKSKAHS